MRMDLDWIFFNIFKHLYLWFFCLKLDFNFVDWNCQNTLLIVRISHFDVYFQISKLSKWMVRWGSVRRHDAVRTKFMLMAIGLWSPRSPIQPFIWNAQISATNAMREQASEKTPAKLSWRKVNIRLVVFVSVESLSWTNQTHLILTVHFLIINSSNRLIQIFI